MENENKNVFSNLPEALVDELLKSCSYVGDEILKNVDYINKKKENLRDSLRDQNLLGHYSDLPMISSPTTCGVDGSYVVERLLGSDLIASAAVALEGLTPPSENKYWEKPYHLVYINSHKHDPDSTMIVRGLMWEMEIILAAKAPHNLVFIDGSITNPFLNINAALAKLDKFTGSTLKAEITKYFDSFLSSYEKIICSNKSNQIWVGVPKYTSKREVGQKLNLSSNYEDRSILTSILKSGEFIYPLPYEQSSDEWHLNISSLGNKESHKKKIDRIIKDLKSLHIFYFKPHPYTPALRIEIPGKVIKNEYKLSTIMNGILYQCGSPSIIEPYPLYMADRMVKSLGKAIPSFRQVATRQMAEKFEKDVSEIFFSMHSYRTESNRM